MSVSGCECVSMCTCTCMNLLVWNTDQMKITMCMDAFTCVFVFVGVNECVSVHSMCQTWHGFRRRKCLLLLCHLLTHVI